jgi:hypothetical protein
MGLGSKIAATLTSYAVPTLAGKFGWRMVPYVYGVATAVFAAAWHVLVSCCCPLACPIMHLTRPPPTVQATNEPRQSLADAGSPAKPKPKGKPEWGVLRVAAAQVTVWGHIVDNFMTYAMNQMGPLVYTVNFGIDAAAVGRFIAIPPTINVVGSFVVAALEGVLLKLGMAQMRIQRLMTAAGAITEVRRAPPGRPGLGADCSRSPYRPAAWPCSAVRRHRLQQRCGGAAWWLATCCTARGSSPTTRYVPRCRMCYSTFESSIGNMQ